MNQSIVRVFIGVALLFLVLIAFTSRWSVFEAESLREKSSNKRSLLRDQTRPSGLIVARDYKILARSRPFTSKGTKLYKRFYPTDELFAHTVGYAYSDRGRAGLEQSFHDHLSGRKEELLGVVDQLLGRGQEPEDLVTTLDPKAQRVALDSLSSVAGTTGRGAVVVIEPRTGRVPVLVSSPSFSPSQVLKNPTLLHNDSASPLFNRATQSGYPPGSTFKVITAAAALDSGDFTAQTKVNGDSPKTVSGAPLNNAGNQDYGNISLTDALTKSVNTVWAQVGERVGKERMYEYMERFGFFTDPPIGLPGDQLIPSGLFKGSRLLKAEVGVDVGRMAIGQERLRVTPLQMATVAATVANGGVRMEPLLVRETRDQDGRTVSEFRPDKVRRVMSVATAAELTRMMGRVVDEGTGTAAAMLGIRGAGKTGTAEVGNGLNNAWFIGFAPVDKPRYAVAVVVERTAGQGGQVAAPIAKRVLESLLK